MAFAFLRFEITLGQQLAEPAISLAIRGIGEGLETIDGEEAGADDELEVFFLFPFFIGADHAGKRIAVGNADSAKAECAGGGDHLPRV